MSKLLVDYQSKIAKKERKEPVRRSKEERRAYIKLRREAFDKGVRLKSGGQGGLSPSLVLHVFRRDNYTCKIHGDHGEGDNGGLEVHHVAGIISSEKQDKRGHANTPANLVVLCARAHDDLHTKARESGIDSSQITPVGDYGTKRDRGDRGTEGLPWRHNNEE